MSGSLAEFSAVARKAAQSNDWTTVRECAAEIQKRDASSPEGYFLAGLVEKAARRPIAAVQAFSKSIELDAGRYDAAIELASQFGMTPAYWPEALKLLEKYQSHLGNSPRYLNMAGLAYSTLGLHERAWPLYQRANDLQPGVALFQANLAACAVYLGEIEYARAIYQSLLKRFPTHQRNHYQLARLAQAGDSTHVDEMQAVLRSTNLPADRNIFLYYAIGKELEDLGRWQEAFHYYKLAGDAVTSVANYDVAADIELIDKIAEVCDAGWLAAGPGSVPNRMAGKTPIFIVGLPRTGSTLTERILASHSQVESAGETRFLQMTLRRVSGVESGDDIDPATIVAAASKDLGLIANGYLDAVAYRLGDRPYFIEKLPENFLYLAFIARAWPDARLVYLRRHPLDTCLAMYKQSYFKFAYTLDNLGRYYVAHARLLEHWRVLLGDRLIEVEYEALVADQEGQTRMLLAKLGLEFEPACLEFEKNVAASATASSVQVREKIHARSVNRWKHFERELQPLRDFLESAGIAIG